MSSAAAPRILFFADAGQAVGGGHVMRCLTLARALTARGAECAFVESRAAAPILRRFGWPAQTLLAIASEEDLPGLLAYARDFAERFQPDVVVIDHYRAEAADHASLRRELRHVAVIDDLANRQVDCDLLVDPSFGRRAEAYAALAPPHATVLTGPTHALVRPEFADSRQRAISRRAMHGPVARALISLGLTDVGGVTARVVRALLPILEDVRLDIVLGAGAASLPVLTPLAERDRRLRLWVDNAEMAPLTAAADIAIGAGGSSVWERAVVGLPGATVILADNQRPMIGQMAAAGLTLAVEASAPDFDDQLRAAWGQLVDEPLLRWRLSERGAELCDGQGAGRVADAMLRLVAAR